MAISKMIIEAYHICNHKVKLFDKVFPPSLILCCSLGEDSDAALHGDLGEEEVVGEEALLEAAELEQPAEESRLLEVGEPLHDLPGDAAALDGRGEVGREALELPPQLRQHEQRLPPVDRRVVVAAVSSARVVATLVVIASAADADAAASGGG
jgi:hypothetical protein